MTGRGDFRIAPWNQAAAAKRRQAHPRYRLLGTAAFLLAFVATWFAPGAAWASPAASQSFGLDISWPQCKTGIPTPSAGHTITIIGVTGGKAFTQNPCFAAEYEWSVSSGHSPALYMNLNSPTRSTAERGQTGPRGNCRPGDASCVAFNYGYNAAQDAVAYAQSAGAATSTWWLDVETMNYWSADRSSNAQVISGAARYFQNSHLAVGIYSITPMWREIAGDLTLGLPIWVAQTDVKVATMAYCAPTYAFAGGTTAMVQSWNGRYDVDFACPAARPGSSLVGPSSSAVGANDGSASSPIPLTTPANGTLTASPGGNARYYTFTNPDSGSQQTVTFSFWPHGPDIANGVYVSLYQGGAQLANVQASNAKTPGYITMSFSSKSGDPFVIRLMNYNDSAATPINYTIGRS